MLTYEITEYFEGVDLVDTTYRFSDGRTYRIQFKVNGRRRETVIYSTVKAPFDFHRSERSALDNRIGTSQLSRKFIAARIDGQCYVDGVPVSKIPRRPDLSHSVKLDTPAPDLPTAPGPPVAPVTGKHSIPWLELCETVSTHGGAVEIGGVKIAKIHPSGLTDEGNQIKGLEERLAEADAKAEYLMRELTRIAPGRGAAVRADSEHLARAQESKGK